MPQPPITPVQARELVRSVPFCAQQTYVIATIATAGSRTVEWDVAAGITDANQLLTAGALPSAGGVAINHATGPFLDAAVYITAAAVAGETGLITVEYAIDRGCSYRLVTPGTAVPVGTFVNISGLRITGRFVRVTLWGSAKNGGTDDLTGIEFGVYVRST